MVEPESVKESTHTGLIPARYALAILASVGMAIVYGLRVNLSTAIVGMVNSTTTATHNFSATMMTDKSEVLDECSVTYKAAVKTPTQGGSFDWSANVQGSIKSAYFWGYLVAQIPAGRIAELFSAKWAMFFGIAMTAGGTLLSPIGAKWHYNALIFLRVLEGIGSGVAYPAMHVILANWAPPSERSTMSSIVYAGPCLGMFIFTLVTGIISTNLGWEAIFYIEGAMSCIWIFLWFVFVADTPLKQKYISEKERTYIVTSLSDQKIVQQSEDLSSKTPFPWKSVLTSLPFWAIVISHTFSNWGWSMMQIELPNYLSNILKLDIAQNSMLSSLPFLLAWIVSLILSKTLDALRNKKRISTTGVRKIATGLASVVPFLSFVVLCSIGCARTLAFVSITLAITACSGMFCGFLANHIDIAPNFAGTLMAMTNTVASIPGVIVPTFVGYLTNMDQSVLSWKIIFGVTAALYLLEVIVFCAFASGEEQEWNKCNKCTEDQPLQDIHQSNK